MQSSLPTKKLYPKNTISIDEKHTEMLDHFHKVETEDIPQLKVEIVGLKDSIRALDEDQI